MTQLMSIRPNILLLTSDSLPLVCCHVLSMGLKSFLPNLRNACPAIRPQYKPDNPGNKIMKLSTVFRVGKFGAIAAGRISCFKAAGADLAPGSFFILVATGASVFQISSASAAIKSTESNQFRIRHYYLHCFPFRKHSNQLGAIDLAGLWNVNTGSINIQMNKLTGLNVCSFLTKYLESPAEAVGPWLNNCLSSITTFPYHPALQAKFYLNKIIPANVDTRQWLGVKNM